MRCQGRYTLARLLYALCGVWAAIAPVAPQIHQSIAKHRHVYCVEHNRIEDETVLETHDRFMARGWRPEFATVSGVVPSSTANGSGVECLLSNFLSHAVTQPSNRAITGLLAAELSTSTPREVDHEGLETYRIAPKTSPPASA